VRDVLKLPAYRRLLAAYTLTQLAWSVGTLALAVQVYRRTGSAIGSTAFFLAAQFIPALISPALVARIDQRPGRRVLPMLYAAEALAFGALAWVTAHFSLAPLLLLATLDGIIALAARSITRAATVAVTSPEGLLREGNALANAAFSVCFFVGPAIGAVVANSGGTEAAMLFNAGLFVVITVMLASARGLPGVLSTPLPTAGRLRAALKHARQHPAIRTLLGLQAAALTFFTISIPVEVVFAVHTLHSGRGGYAALLSAWGGGTVAGSAVYARWRSLASRTLIATGAAALGLGFVLMAIAPSLAVAIIGAAIAGTGNGVEAVAARTSLQEHVEQQWMAMVMSLNESLFQAVPGLGILIGGTLTAVTGTRVALGVAAGGAFAVTGLAWIVLRPGDAIAGPGSPAPATRR
jgi:MFS family permease